MNTTHDNIEIPNPKTDYHGHPNYEKVFLGLLVLLGISLLAGHIFSPVVTVILIFVAAAIKAALVIRNFMHLKYEPLVVWIAVIAVFFCLALFFFGIYPDITASKLIVTPK